MTKKEAGTLDLKGKGILVVLSGPSGSGKDTVLEKLKESDFSFDKTISATTRAMRDGEKDGVDYYFIDKNTFEEKAAIAKSYGAIACIIYNNIDGDIIMSMGKSDHIPTISISKDDGEILAKKDNGTLTLSTEFQAGPFMSDFSSWGPTPSLGLKPEITAHGGTITSSIPGGGYDELSGTSMATPNLCGIVVLIRQYLKEKYPTSEINLSIKKWERCLFILYVSRRFYYSGSK